jgi:hypothetical protein
MAFISTNHMILVALVAAVLYKVHSENTEMKGQVNSMERYLVVQARQNQQQEQQQHGDAPSTSMGRNKPRSQPKRRDPGMSSGDDDDIPPRSNFESEDEDAPKVGHSKSKNRDIFRMGGSSEAVADSMIASDPIMGRR